VFLGDVARSRALDDAATTLRSRGTFVLSVVPDTDRYNSYVPTSLSGINGVIDQAADPQIESIAQRIMEDLRLVRDKRLVSIS